MYAPQIPASYRLQPSSCSLCLICALSNNLDANRMKAAAVAAVENAHFECRYVEVLIFVPLLLMHTSSEKALLADLKDGLALIIT